MFDVVCSTDNYKQWILLKERNIVDSDPCRLFLSTISVNISMKEG